MIKLVFPGDELKNLTRAFRGERIESFALILAQPVKISAMNWRLVVDSVHVPPPAEYEVRSETEVRPASAFRLPFESRARKQGLSLVYCHSHPAQVGATGFSAADDRGEKPLAIFANQLVPNTPHLALLIGKDATLARVLGGDQTAEIWGVGRDVVSYSSNAVPAALSNEYDRQIRAFGEEGQRAIQALKVGIVGLGGTGSVIAQQLAHLGVRRFLLIDPDHLEETNLNRVVGATTRDVGRTKVSIAASMIRSLVSSPQIQTITGDVLDRRVGRSLRSVDFVFCCTDSHGSRHFINQLAYQYFIPCIDMGVAITVSDRRITHFGGRVQMLAPGLACLVCHDGIISPNQVRWDLSNERQRQADPYFVGHEGEKQPSVISLNSTAASLGLTMFLAAVAGVPSRARSLQIRGVQGDVRVWDDTPRPNCVNCSSRGLFGTGDRTQLPMRARNP